MDGAWIGYDQDDKMRVVVTSSVAGKFLCQITEEISPYRLLSPCRNGNFCPLDQSVGIFIYA